MVQANAYQKAPNSRLPPRRINKHPAKSLFPHFNKLKIKRLAASYAGNKESHKPGFGISAQETFRVYIKTI